MNSLTTVSVACVQSQADADFLISNSAIELAFTSNRPVILVGKDTDLLAMLLDRARPKLYMQFARNAIYNINDIKEALHPNIKNHLVVAHAISGSDTLSALLNVGIKKVLKVLQQED